MSIAKFDSDEHYPICPPLEGSRDAEHLLLVKPKLDHDCNMFYYLLG